MFGGGVAVITGAGSGIGAGLARHAAKLGMTTVLADVDAAETAAPTPNNSDSGSEHSKPKPWFKRLSLTTWIFIALILGVLAGLALQG